MLGVAWRIGLLDAEAEDAVQASMLCFFEAYRDGKDHRERGRLSAFLITILRARAIDVRRRARSRRESPASVEVIEQLSQDDVTRLWFDERQNQLLRQAIDELRGQGADGSIIAGALYGDIDGDGPTRHAAKWVNSGAAELMPAPASVSALGSMALFSTRRRR